MADYYQLKNQNIFNPPANTSLGSATNQFDDAYIQNELVLGNVTVTGSTIVSPKVSTITYPGDDTAADPAGGQTITLTGTGFLVGATVLINNIEVSVVSVVSSTTITFTSPANATGSYILYVINTDGGTAIAIPGIQYSGTPTWTTAAGSLGSVYETASFNSTVTATGDAPITYSVASGTLPPGATFNSNGTITGTSELLASPTTYTFTVRATDAELQDTNRTFSLTINPDVVTWVSPSNNATYTVTANSAISNVTLSATSAVGSGITYSANTLPTGISLSGDIISGTPTVSANSSSLLTATANTTSESSNITINWTVSVANDIYFEYNTLLIPGASTTFVDDASTNNFAVTINGDTKPNNNNPYTPGYYSNYFDGSGDSLDLPSSTQFVFGNATNFTIEAWICPFGYAQAGNGPPDKAMIWSTGVAEGGTARPMFSLSSTGKILFGGWNGNAVVGATTIPLNTWSHVAVSFDGTTYKVFYNGVLDGSGSSIYNFSTTPLTASIGSNPDNTYRFPYYGYISNLRVVRGTAVYTTSFTPSTIPLTAISNTVLLSCQSNRFIDNSTNNFAITVAGNTSINSFDPFTPNSSYSSYGSGYFDGTGDYLTVPYNSALNLGSDTTWTMEYWVYFNAAFGTYTPISFVQSGLLRWNMEHTAASTNFLFNNSTAVSFTNPSTLVPSTWYHIAWVRDGTTVRMYINGVASSTTSTNNLQSISSGPLNIGYNALGGYEFYMNGYITDVRLVKGTAVYTTAFTPPASPLTAIANTSLLTLQNNQSVSNSVFLDNSTNNLLVTRAGNTTQGTFSPYGGNWSNYFGGQMVSTLSPSSTNFNLTGDFTLEAYVFLTALPGGDWGILDARTAGASATPWLYGIGGNAKIYFYDGSVRSGTATINLNTWYHIAWVRNGSVLRGYVNGVLDYYNGSYGTSAISPGSTSPVIGTKDYGISGYGTTGYISNLRVVNGTAVYTTSSTTVGATIFTPSTTPLTPITNTVLLSSADSRFIDDSVNNYTITPSSSTISAQRFSPFNPSSVTPTSYSGYLDGSGDWLTAPDNDALDLGSSDFTIEGWFYQTGNLSTSSGGTGLVTKWTDASNQRSWQLSIRNAAGTATFYYSTSGSDYPAITFNSVTLTSNTWTHFALVRTGNTLNLYKNGTLAGTSAFNNTIYNSTSPLAIGAWFGGSAGVPDTAAGNTLFQGYTSNIRVVKGVAVYTSAFTVPTSPLQATQSSGTNIAAITGTSTSLLTCQSPTFIDNSTNNFVITAYGNSQPTIQNPFGYTSATTNGYTVSTIGGSGYFDGSSDYVSVTNSSTWSSLSNNFTIECWFYLNSVAIGQQLIFSQRTSGGEYCPYLIWVTNTTITMYSSSNNGSWDVLNGATIASGLTAGQWYHLAFTRSGSTNRIFLNGVQTYTYTNSSSFTNSNKFNLGMAPGETNTALNGYITDARLLNGTALYTSNFVPPSAPLTAIQNTGLLTNMTSAGIYDASMMNNLETLGDAKLSTAISKFGGSSMSFDGTGDYLTSPFNPSFNLGAGNFTIEFWVNTTSTVAYATALRLGDTWTTGSWALYLNDSNGNGYPSWWAEVPYTLSTSGASINDGSWHHIALVRNGSSFVMYIDGTSRGTLTNSASVGDTTTKLWIGRDSSNVREWAGYMDDLRITKGYARYTSNFTPPTSAFPLY